MSIKRIVAVSLAIVTLVTVCLVGFQVMQASHFAPATYTESLRFDTPAFDDGMYFDIAQSENVVIAVGDEGKIKRSTDKGSTWEIQQLPTHSTLLTVTFSSPKNVFVAGHQGTLLKSDDAGESWQKISFDQTLDLPNELVIFDSLAASNKTIYFTGNRGTLISSKDNGDSFETKSIGYAMSGNDLYSINELSFGDLVITSSAGNVIFSSPAASSEWKVQRVSWSEAILGLIEEENGALMAYGTGGALYRRENSSKSWERVTTPTKADFYTGHINSEGTLVVAGSGGVIIRIANGQKRFFIDPQSDHGAILAMYPIAKGDVLFAGRAGLFRLKNEQYTSMDAKQPVSGEYVKQQLMNMPLTQHILTLASPPNRRSGTSYKAAVDRLSARWISFDLTFADPNNSGVKQSFYSPTAYQYVAKKIDVLSDMLDVQTGLIKSIWTGGLDYTLMSTFLNRTNFNVEPQSADYGLVEQHALQNTLRQSGYSNIYIGEKGEWASLIIKESYIPLQEREMLTGYKFKGNRKWEKDNPDDNSVTERARELVALFDDNDNVTLSSITRFEVVKVYDSSAPPSLRGAEGIIDPQIVAYTISVSDEIESCANAPIVEAAMALQAPLKALDETGAVITLGYRAAWLRAIDHNTNWKWFAPGAANRAMRQGFSPWGGNMCPRTALLLYTQPETQDVSAILHHTIKQVLAEHDLALTQEDLVLRGFALKKERLN